MPITAQILNGTSRDSRAIQTCLDELLTKATTLMNSHTLPMAVPLFPDDVLPTNQRNLTDVRTRIGVLLEYEFAKAVNASLPPEVTREGLALTYVIANQFPDLAFRSSRGELGIRFEVKAIEAIAEEKSANFSTLLKDVRKETDFVVTLLWEWQQHHTRNLRFPQIHAFFVMNAYHLAQMRDCNWLNNPPKALQSARQGFDLTFAVNAKGDSFNQEEGNYGKLMRIFDSKHQHLLPTEVQQSDTLRTYYQMTQEVARLGLVQVATNIATAAAGQAGNISIVEANSLPVRFVIERDEGRLLIMGGRVMPRKSQARETMNHHLAHHALLLSEKFSWAVYDADWNRIDGGRKPATAEHWVQELWQPIIQNPDGD